MRLPPFPFVVLDTETTGFFPRSDRILELALLRYEGGEQVAEYESLYTVEREIPAHVQVITRIHPEHLREAPLLASEREKIASMLSGAVIVGHNILFDLAMLRAEGIDLEGSPFLDTAMLASLVFPELESWSLGYVSTALDLPHEPKHRALGDVHATVALLGRVYERLQELPEVLTKQLQELSKRGPEGYALLLSSLHVVSKERPVWLKLQKGGRGVSPPAPLRRIAWEEGAQPEEKKEDSLPLLLRVPLSSPSSLQCQRPL